MTYTLGFYVNNKNQTIGLYTDKFQEKLIKTNYTTKKVEIINELNYSCVDDIILDVNTDRNYFFKQWFYDSIVESANECDLNEKEEKTLLNFTSKIMFIDENRTKREKLKLLRKLCSDKDILLNRYFTNDTRDNKRVF